MAHIEDRGSARPARWRVRWRDQGRFRSRSFARKADATRFLHELESRRSSGSWIDPRLGQTAVGELAELYLARVDATRKLSTSVAYREVWRSLVSARWAGEPVAGIRWTDVAAWIAELTGSGLSASRVRHAHGLLKRVLDDAVHDGLLRSNPALGVPLPTLPPHGDHRRISFAELQALADAAGHYRAFVLLLGLCGLRWSEAVAIQVRDVELDRARIRIARSLVSPRGRLEADVPKTHAIRWIPIPEILRPQVEALSAGRAAGELVFVTPRGAPIGHRAFLRGPWARAVTAAGLEGLTPHGLRHAAAYLAHSVGADYRDVQALLGHKRATTTIDVYQALFRPDLDALAARMSAALTAEAAEAQDPSGP